jgi:hypothetical protein
VKHFPSPPGNLLAIFRSAVIAFKSDLELQVGVEAESLQRPELHQSSYIS